MCSRRTETSTQQRPPDLPLATPRTPCRICWAIVDDFYDRKVDLYQHTRTPAVNKAVQAMLPVGGRLLDVGCSTGNLLGQFRDSASFLAGIDVSSRACALADQVADIVINAAVESAEFPFEDHTFDVVVCADVLEHLIDPMVGLEKAIRWCKFNGSIVVSVPNIAYWQARLKLLRGVWRYEEAGIFDNGHLRFFTYDSLFDLLESAGLKVTAYRPILLPLRSHVRGLRRLPGIRSALEHLWTRLGERRPSLFARQHVCTCRPTALPIR